MTQQIDKSQELTAAQERIKLLEKVLGDVKLRIAFMGWPAEAMWQTNGGNWVPDWREECAWIDHALHGTPIDEAELASFVSTPANRIPDTAPATALPTGFTGLLSQVLRPEPEEPDRPQRPRG